MSRLLLALCLILLSAGAVDTASAQSVQDNAPLQFVDAAEEKRFHTLAAELRCVMCQNQSLADSNALIAHELRREVLALMRQGKDDHEVQEFLVARYGEFVLYQPRVESKTWLLWFGPLLLVLAGAIVIVVIVRHRAQGATLVPRDDTQEW